jgi:hypothetical protein
MWASSTASAYNYLFYGDLACSLKFQLALIPPFPVDGSYVSASLYASLTQYYHGYLFYYVFRTLLIEDPRLYIPNS